MAHEGGEDPEMARTPIMLRAVARSMDFRISVWPLVGAVVVSGIYVNRTMDRLTAQNEQMVQSIGRLETSVKSLTEQITTAAIAQGTINGEIRVLSTRLDRIEADHDRIEGRRMAGNRRNE